MQRALKLIRENQRAFLNINLAFFGLVVVAAAYSFVNPQLQRQLIQSIVQGFDAPPLSFARDAYLSGDVVGAALLTFAVNSFGGSLLTITVPSLLVPFAGLAIGFYRAVIWGIALAPTSPELARAMIPHSLTLLLEGEAYVLAMFGAYTLWKSALGGLRDGLWGLVSGYVAGLRGSFAVYLLVIPVLAVAAIYEAFEIIYLVGR